MTPGKLYKLHNNRTTIYPYNRDNFNEIGKTLYENSYFLLLKTNPDDKISNFYDLKIPWLILFESEIGLIDINKLYLMDMTDELGNKNDTAKK